MGKAEKLGVRKERGKQARSTGETGGGRRKGSREERGKGGRNGQKEWKERGETRKKQNLYLGS